MTVTTVDAAGQSDTASSTIDVVDDERSRAFVVDGLLNSTAVVGVLLAIGAVAIGTFLFARAEG